MKRSTIITLVLVVLLAGTSAFAQLAGKVNVPGDYPTLNAALADLNAKGVAEGGVSIIVAPENPVTAPLGGFAITTKTVTAQSPVTIDGGGNLIVNAAGATIESLFRTSGTEYITITNFATAEGQMPKMEKADLPSVVRPNR